jgi:ABC-type transporter Mla subunit MlaD
MARKGNTTKGVIEPVKKNIIQGIKDRRNKERKKARDKYDNRLEDLPRGLQIDTTTSAYGDAGKGRKVPEFNKGGYCRGAGAAIKGTDFKGVF